MTTGVEASYELRSGSLYVDGSRRVTDPLAVEAAVEAWNAGETERLDAFQDEPVAVPAELGRLILHVATRLEARPDRRLLPRAAAV